jgi:anthranilate phosphoribosyltransferase
MERSAHKSDAFTEIIRIVGRGRKLQRDLTTDEAATAMRLLLTDNDVSDAQVGAFLVTMRVKEETVDEIIGFARAAREAMQPFPRPQVDQLIDLALPYDGKENHLQTGVAVGLILAAAGVPVLMHGADNIPAKCGVAPLNLLRALDYPADMPPDAVSHAIETTGFGVLNLAQILPQWTDLTPLRHHFGLRTLLNSTEKLLNPASAPIHISGFYHSSYLARMAQALPGKKANWIIQGEEGSIDLRLGKKTRVYQAVGDDMVETMIDAGAVGFPDVHPLEMPKDAAAHVEVIRRVLEGEPSHAADQIVLTAGALLWMVGAEADIAVGITTARESLHKGHALNVLEQSKHLMELSR